MRQLLFWLFLPLLTACSNLLFFPAKDWPVEPSTQGYEYQHLKIPMVDGIHLSAWLMPYRATEKNKIREGAVIYFHGNAQNISSHAPQVLWLLDEGYDVLLVDYRGYGHSEGAVNLHKNIDDIADAIRYFFKLYPQNINKVLLGQSLGAAMSGYVVATQADLRKGFDAIVLDSGFAQYRRITRDVFSGHWLTWVFQYPASWTITGRYDLLPVVDQIAPTPLLIVHGTQDAVVPYAHGEDLFSQARRPKSLLSFEGGHIEAFHHQENRQALINFFQTGKLKP